MRRRDTAPELSLRRALHKRGIRFRVSLDTLPGTPDVVLVRPRLAIFVDGCFWHVCPDHAVIPKANREFWIEKLEENRARDRRKDVALTEIGWEPVHVWEHEDPEKVADVLAVRWRYSG